MPLLRLLIPLLLSITREAAGQVTPAPGGLASAGADSGGFIVRLGNDTLALERYRRAPDGIRGEVVLRVPDLRRVRYTATFTLSGAVGGLDVRMTPVEAGTSAPSHGVMRFDGDSADVILTMEDRTRHLRVPARQGAVPLTAFSHALIEQAILQALRSGRDSVAFDWLGLGAAAASPSYVVRCTDDSVRLAFFGDPGYAKLDRGGRILRLDGRETTVKVEVERLPSVDLDRHAAEFAAEQAVTGPLGPLSPRDTARAVIHGATLQVDYGRPRKRGREIFGGVVPWHRIWRLGANAATQLSTSGDLEIAGRLIPAGTYSLFLLPTPSGATLIVNRQTGQWGTTYDAARDLARLPLAAEHPAAAADQFTIAFDSAAAGGLLRMTWDTTSYRLPFLVRAPGPAAGS
jgi:hypothetical protein